MRTTLATLALVVLAAVAAADDLAPLISRYQREKGKPYQVRYKVLQEISQVETDAAARLLIRISQTDEESSMRRIGDDSAPHILIYSSGDVTPFDLAITRRPTDQTVRLEADLTGAIEMADGEDG